MQADRHQRMTEIRAAFGYSEADDAASARILAGLAGDLWDAVRARLEGTSPTVLCCGPSLERTEARHLGRPLVCADGATTRARELGWVPDLVVTDLDGPAQDLLWAARNGAILVVHAHGDNADHIARIVRRAPPVAGTCQIGAQRPDPLLDLGGFTDGDRAVLLCEAMGARGVRLVAFEPDLPPSRFSHDWDPRTKPRKLAFAAQIVTDAAKRFPVEPIVP